MGAEPGLGECFGLSGWIKIVESFAVFTCLMLHRIGDQGQQVYGILLSLQIRFIFTTFLKFYVS